MVVRKWGTETQVNTDTAAQQSEPAVTSLPDGGYVAVWTTAAIDDGDLTAIKMQRFDALGQKVAGEVLVNTNTIGYQIEPVITTLADGSYVVVWTDVAGTDATNAQTVFRRYAADGTPLDIVDRLAVDIGNGNVKPEVTAFANGDFAITTSYPSVGEIYLHLFDAAGNLTGNFSPVSEGNFSDNPHVAISPTGAMAVTFADRVTNEIKVWFQGGDTGVGGTTEIVTFFAAEDNNNPHVLALSNGGFVVTWTDGSFRFPDTSGTAIRARFYTNEGQPFGGDFVVNHTTAGNQRSPVMTALSDGGFAVFYESGGGDGILGQIFNPDGTRRGVEFKVNTIAMEEQEILSAALLADGRIVVTWSNENGNGDGDTAFGSIQMQIIDPRDGIVTGDSAGNLLYGHDALSDEISGLDGDDIMHGLRGNDSIYGGGGNDQAFGGQGDDVLYGGTGNDDLRGSSGEDLILGEGGDDILRGQNGDDEMIGGSGNDILIGDRGNDIQTGSAGNDTFSYRELDEGGDFITDFSSTGAGNNDRFEFKGTAFGGLAPGGILGSQFQSSKSDVAKTPDVRFFFEKDTYILRYDPDGNGTEAAIVIATLQSGATVTVNDVLII